MLADTLLVIDMQKGVLKSGDREIYRHEALLQNVNARIAAYRAAEKPVIFIQHHDKDLIKDSEDWQLSEALDFRTRDIFVDKIHADSFYKTTLAEKLTALSAKKLEICGAETPFCVDATVKAAFDRGYELQMKKRDTTSTYDNPWMTAETCVAFYEAVWQHFASLVD